MTVAGSLVRAFGSLLHPRMLWLMLWPVLVALAIWGSAALVLWMRIVVRLAGLLQKWIETAVFFVQFDAADAATLAAHLLVFLAWVPLVYLTVLLILGVFGMPAMVEHVARRSFPDLARRRGGSFAGSLGNALAALAGLAVLGAITLPLWAFPLLWPAIPVAVMGWANQRLLRYDALAEHAEAGEMARIFRERRGALYLLGVLLAVAAYVPLAGLFAPMLFGLAFIHYLLGALRERRSAPSEVSSA
jgi:hypothetical protein